MLNVDNYGWRKGEVRASLKKNDGCELRASKWKIFFHIWISLYRWQWDPTAGPLYERRIPILYIAGKRILLQDLYPRQLKILYILDE